MYKQNKISPSQYIFSRMMAEYNDPNSEPIFLSYSLAQERIHNFADGNDSRFYNNPDFYMTTGKSKYWTDVPNISWINMGDYGSLERDEYGNTDWNTVIKWMGNEKFRFKQDSDGYPIIKYNPETGKYDPDFNFFDNLAVSVGARNSFMGLTPEQQKLYILICLDKIPTLTDEQKRKYAEDLDLVRVYGDNSDDKTPSYVGGKTGNKQKDEVEASKREGMEKWVDEHKDAVIKFGNEVKKKLGDGLTFVGGKLRDILEQGKSKIIKPKDSTTTTTTEQTPQETQKTQGSTNNVPSDDDLKNLTQTDMNNFINKYKATGGWYANVQRSGSEADKKVASYIRDNLNGVRNDNMNLTQDKLDDYLRQEYIAWKNGTLGKPQNQGYDRTQYPVQQQQNPEPISEPSSQPFGSNRMLTEGEKMLVDKMERDRILNEQRNNPTAPITVQQNSPVTASLSAPTNIPISAPTQTSTQISSGASQGIGSGATVTSMTAAGSGSSSGSYSVPAPQLKVYTSPIPKNINTANLQQSTLAQNQN